MASFSAVEIYGIAEQIERNGVKYYRTAAAAADGQIKTLLLELAEMEADHEKAFTEMRHQLDQIELDIDPSPGSEEICAYLRAMAAGRVFDLRTDPSEQLSDGTLTGESVLRKAIDLEKDSIVFYLGLQQLAGSDESKQKVEQIIQEEMAHVGMLSEKLSEQA